MPTTTIATTVFGDPACTQLLAFNANSACPPADYASLVTFDGSDMPISTSFYPRVAGPAPTAYYSGTGSSCAGPITVTSNNQLSVLGPEVARAEFAPVALGDPEGGAGPLHARYERSDDGARLRPVLHDDDLADDCYLSTSDDRMSASCYPYNVALSIDEYLDPDCKVPGVEVEAVSPPRYVDVFTTDCPFSGARTHMVGAPAPMQMLYLKRLGCRPKRLAPGNAAYTIGAEAMFRPLAQVPPIPGGGRLQRLRYADGQIIATVDSFFDPVIDTTCYSVELADGTVRCLPIYGLPISSASFSDANCQVPIHVASVPTEACDGLPVPKFASLDSSPACPSSPAIKPSYELRRVIGSYPGTVFVANGPGGCTQLTGTTSYELSAPVPLDQFAAATLMTDP